MNSSKLLGKAVFSTTLILALLSLFWLWFVLRKTLVEWPTMTLVTFVLWSLVLCMNSYKKLKEELIYVKTTQSSVLSSADSYTIPVSRQYQDLRTRHVFYLVGLAVIWFIFFYGGLGRDDYGEISYDTPMTALALKYFGYKWSFDSIDNFSYFSWRHEILFYALCFLPIIILICDGLIIYEMSERRLVKALKEHVHSGTDSSIQYP